MPRYMRDIARECIEDFQKDIDTPCLEFRKFGNRPGLYYLRVDRPNRRTGYRAVGMLDGDTIGWFFVADHDEFMAKFPR